MSARAMAKATVSFGLVSIPVKLYSAGESSAGVHLNLLHAACGSRVRQQYYCPTEDVVVERRDLAKGYEFARDQFVVVDEEDLAALSTRPTNAIEIAEFVPISSVDPIFFDRAYYLGPDKGGDRPYRLLAEAMRQTGRVALARYAARGKNYLVLLRPFEEGLVMQQLHFADEIRSFSEVPIGEAEVKDKELELAKQLVEQITSEEFRPQTYEDESRKQLMELIERKIAGQEVTAAPREQPKAQVIDLMEALKASIAAGDASRDASRKPPQRATPAAKSKRRTATAGGTRRRKAK
ncbi:MAG TPA: Ku protein [Thermoanaerobaculia bacterium]|nr:Ku protein [Thermoanaerobaculia bacterium]